LFYLFVLPQGCCNSSPPLTAHAGNEINIHHSLQHSDWQHGRVVSGWFALQSSESCCCCASVGAVHQYVLFGASHPGQPTVRVDLFKSKADGWTITARASRHMAIPAGAQLTQVQDRDAGPLSDSVNDTGSASLSATTSSLSSLSASVCCLVSSGDSLSSFCHVVTELQVSYTNIVVWVCCAVVAFCGDGYQPADYLAVGRNCQTFAAHLLNAASSAHTHQQIRCDATATRQLVQDVASRSPKNQHLASFYVNF
jgi:hypothetical protein